jgi:hypothetical protein
VQAQPPQPRSTQRSRHRRVLPHQLLPYASFQRRQGLLPRLLQVLGGYSARSGYHSQHVGGIDNQGARLNGWCRSWCRI